MLNVTVCARSGPAIRVGTASAIVTTGDAQPPAHLTRERTRTSLVEGSALACRSPERPARAGANNATRAAIRPDCPRLMVVLQTLGRGVRAPSARFLARRENRTR